MILEKLQSELTLEKAKELLKLGFMPNTIYGLYPELKPKSNPESYNDIIMSEGYVIVSNPNGSIVVNYNPEVHKRAKFEIYPTPEDAWSSIFRNVLIQLLRNTEGTDVDYDSYDAKYAIVRASDRLTIIPIYHTYDLLAFNTKEQAERFLSLHIKNICKYYNLKYNPDANTSL